MKPAINQDALEALAAIALQLHFSQDALDDLQRRCDPVPDASDMARALTLACHGDSIEADRLPDRQVGDAICHMLGFNFGLLVGAAIATAPALQTPDLTEIIKLAREQTKRWAKERLPAA